MHDRENQMDALIEGTDRASRRPHGLDCLPIDADVDAMSAAMSDALRDILREEARREEARRDVARQG